MLLVNIDTLTPVNIGHEDFLYCNIVVKEKY